jgi:hypothetical protein
MGKSESQLLFIVRFLNQEQASTCWELARVPSLEAYQVTPACNEPTPSWGDKIQSSKKLGGSTGITSALMPRGCLEAWPIDKQRLMMSLGIQGGDDPEVREAFLREVA